MSPTVPGGDGGDAAQRKAEADARKAEAEAEKAERDNAEAESPEAKAEKAAAHRKAIAEAERDAAKAAQERVAALLPDFSKIEAGSLDVKGDQALFGVAMAQRALEGAAATLATRVKDALTGVQHGRLLVTGDADLATSDGAYLDVMTGLDQLTTWAESVLELVPEPAPADGEALAPLAVAGAVAQALPGLVSLFSAKRTVASFKADVSDLAAAAAAIGALRAAQIAGLSIVHDDVRLPELGGALQTKLTSFATARKNLTKRKLELGAGADATKVGLIDDAAKAMDTFTGDLTTVPQGAKRSLLTEAVLRRQLHGNDADRFTHVLLVKAQAGGLDQVVDDKPLWFADTVSVAGAVSVAYVLVATEGSEALAGGCVTGLVSGHGTIGDALTFKVDPEPPSPAEQA